MDVDCTTTTGNRSERDSHASSGGCKGSRTSSGSTSNTDTNCGAIGSSKSDGTGLHDKNSINSSTESGILLENHKNGESNASAVNSNNSASQIAGVDHNSANTPTSVTLSVGEKAATSKDSNLSALAKGQVNNITTVDDANNGGRSSAEAMTTSNKTVVSSTISTVATALSENKTLGNSSVSGAATGDSNTSGHKDTASIASSSSSITPTGLKAGGTKDTNEKNNSNSSETTAGTNATTAATTHVSDCNSVDAMKVEIKEETPDTDVDIPLPPHAISKHLVSA